MILYRNFSNRGKHRMSFTFKTIIPAKGKGKSKYVQAAVKKQIVPYQEHIPHVQKLLNRVVDYTVAVEASPPGAGKTYILYICGRELARQVGSKYFVALSTAAALSKFELLKNEYETGFDYDKIICLSYNALRGTGNHPLKHDLLVRKNNGDGKPDFEASPTWIEMVKAGVVLVIDESQKASNDGTLTVAATYALTKALFQLVAESVERNKRDPRFPIYPSFVFFSSATLLQQEKQVPVLTKLMGLTDSNNTKENFYKLRKYCEYLDPDLTEEIVGDGVADYVEATAMLFSEVIMKYLSDKVETVEGRFKLHRIALNVNLSMESSFILTHGIAKLINAVEFDVETGESKSVGGWNDMRLRLITEALQLLEEAKVEAAIRLAKQYLDSDPNVKICIFPNYDETIQTIIEAFPDMEIVVLTGSTTAASERQKAAGPFQEDSNRCRLLIGSVGACSESLDLDDKTGRHPRVAFEFPSFKTSSDFQVSGRLMRGNGVEEGSTLSDAYCYYLYGKTFTKEVLLLLSAQKKGKMLAMLHGKRNASGELDESDREKFPDRFPKQKEEDVIKIDPATGKEYNETEQIQEIVKRALDGQKLDTDEGYADLISRYIPEADERDKTNSSFKKIEFVFDLEGVKYLYKRATAEAPAGFSEEPYEAILHSRQGHSYQITQLFPNSTLVYAYRPLSAREQPSKARFEELSNAILPKSFLRAVLNKTRYPIPVVDFAQLAQNFNQIGYDKTQQMIEVLNRGITLNDYNDLKQLFEEEKSNEEIISFCDALLQKYVQCADLYVDNERYFIQVGADPRRIGPLGYISDVTIGNMATRGKKIKGAIVNQRPFLEVGYAKDYSESIGGGNEFFVTAVANQ